MCTNHDSSSDPPVVRPSFGEQDANGIDLSLLRENLKLTPTERMEKHQRALALVLEVRRAGESARLSRRTKRAQSE